MFAALLSLSASKRLKASITSLFCLIDNFLFDIFWITFCPYNCQEDTENDDTEEEWSGTKDDSNIVYYECRGKCLHLVQGWKDKGKVFSRPRRNNKVSESQMKLINKSITHVKKEIVYRII